MIKDKAIKDLERMYSDRGAVITKMQTTVDAFKHQITDQREEIRELRLTIVEKNGRIKKLENALEMNKHCKHEIKRLKQEE